MVQGWQTLRYAEWLKGGGPWTDAELSPIHQDFRGTAPVVLQAGGMEILVDMIRDFAQVLVEQGAAVRLDVWPLMTHEFQAYGDLLPQSRQAIECLRAALAWAAGEATPAFPPDAPTVIDRLRAGRAVVAGRGVTTKIDGSMMRRFLRRFLRRLCAPLSAPLTAPLSAQFPADQVAAARADRPAHRAAVLRHRRRRAALSWPGRRPVLARPPHTGHRAGLPRWAGAAQRVEHVVRHARRHAGDARRPLTCGTSAGASAWSGAACCPAWTTWSGA